MEEVYRYLKQYFGFEEFRPLQEEAIRQVMAGGDVILVMPTGGGKSLCFQLPSLLMKKTVVVISPLISLMKDQVDGLKMNGVEAAALNSSLTPMQNARILKIGREGRLNLLYLSPERLLMDPSVLGQMEVGLFAVDEAHCISQWGHDFRPEYTKLKMLKERFPGIPVMALTATADKITRKDIAIQLGLRDPGIFVASFNRPNLNLNVLSGLSTTEKYRDILRFIDRHRGESGIVYCLSRKETERMSAMLKENGLESDFYHAGMESKDRHKVQDDFINDRISIICATIAFGMGIDKPDVRFVLHLDLPDSLEAYFQEAGRAGRDGDWSVALMIYNGTDKRRLHKMVTDAFPEID
ncbi:MAG: ATP-dependent DNA helicase, partial [Bacteroidetes bacterium]|nr:ATP-dependent DNA helicase [Bacteroidota bacterium]